MNINKVNFNTSDQPEFFKELNKRVNKYFKDSKSTKYANLNMMVKTVFMVSLYFIPLALMLSHAVTTLWAVMLMWVIMGLGMSGIGLCVMHDANHGSYSKNKIVNKSLGFLINFIGGFHANWKIQHNILHHSYTNVHGFDDDIDKGVMRFSPDQKQKSIYKFQAFYAPLFYGLMTIYWFMAKDFQQLFRYHKKGLLAGQGLTFHTALIQIIFHKTWYIILTLILPILVVDLHGWQVFSGFLLMHFICGLILALVFQSAHVIEETCFYKPDENGSIENNWAIHQLRTTANFANTSGIFSWLIGGLNYQIEHHLFPTICHVHYKHISKIVKTTTKEFNLPYHQHTSFVGALKSHFSHLNQMGNQPE